MLAEYEVSVRYPRKNRIELDWERTQYRFLDTNVMCNDYRIPF